MFGYVKPYLEDLRDEEKARYKSFYCGLCRALGERHGTPAQLSLSYDMTFLAMFLSSLYETKETEREAKCLPHPGKTHREVSSAVIDYTADMTVILTYHKCMDDWHDEHKLSAKTMADILRKPYDRVKQCWPEQCEAIERYMTEFSEIESSGTPVPDEAAKCFGRMMQAVFLWRKDFWQEALGDFAMALGQFIYIMDAAMDWKNDMKSGSYNPLVSMNIKPEEARDMMKVLLGQASQVFESLPMLQDEHILRNIIYSGVWQEYNAYLSKQQEGAKQ